MVISVFLRRVRLSDSKNHSGQSSESKQHNANNLYIGPVPK
jgi:hypothetical protein